MNLFPSKGTLDAKVKRRYKRKQSTRKFEIKEEVIIKEEPRDGGELIHCSPPSSPVGATQRTLKPESESDSEVCSEYDLDYTKKEIKSEDEECTKKSCCSSSPNDGSNQRKGDDRNSGNRLHPEQNANQLERRRRITNVCDYAASWKISLIRHIRRHTGEKPFVCEICEKAFTQKHHLKRHKKVHATEFPFHCPKCRRGFKQEVEKIEHENQCQHRQFECIECKYITDNSSHFKQHMPIHSDVRPFQCRICSKTFIRKNHLRQHSRTHTKQLPFACSKCGQRFADESCKKTHEDRCNCLRFECYLCPFKCFQKSHLKYHMQSKHTGEKQFQCKVCYKKFFVKVYLKKHLAIHVKPSPIRCIKCCRRFVNEGDKNAHEEHCNRRHYECYICKASVRDSLQLKSHMRN
ncbi:zinc finger protein OZF-like [Contarinia nasturtii]|uniref:zinc finger protein OZF-like n=1 Tax=Contarinia nasturtii TaxID=265458 RepID=UPI0012D496C9|nr:zinc finger protein OZF-like [Contarinia nasturtii]